MATTGGKVTPEVDPSYAMPHVEAVIREKPLIAEGSKRKWGRLINPQNVIRHRRRGHPAGLIWNNRTVCFVSILLPDDYRPINEIDPVEVPIREAITIARVSAATWLLLNRFD